MGFPGILPMSKVKSTLTFNTSTGCAVPFLWNTTQILFSPRFSVPFRLMIAMCKSFVRVEATVISVRRAESCPARSDSGISSATAKMLRVVISRTLLVPALTKTSKRDSLSVILAGSFTKGGSPQRNKSERCRCVKFPRILRGRRIVGLDLKGFLRLG